MLNPGDKAPSFSLPSDSGEETSLKSLLDKTLVLYFYPKADTPGCTSEANQFRDAKKEIEKAGGRVAGMSGDSIEDLQKFRDKYLLNFPLLSDTSHQTLEAYGVWQEKNMYGRKSMGVVRTTYIIGPDGKVKKVFPRVKVDGHIHEVLAALKQ
ncbi:MAG TPA: thioredoxin-dependent thiol peroxidase [Terriglobia bacterium]|nr:thioredoxin-dependent thiol peroxidase [Terriglobia bacterium]